MGLKRGQARRVAANKAATEDKTGPRRRNAVATVALCGWMTLGGLALPPSLVAYGLAAPAAADAPDTTGKTVSIDVTAADLHAVVNMLEKQAGVEASIRDGDQPFKPVYVHLENASLAKALRTIAGSANATVTLNSDGVYVFEPQGAAPRAFYEAPALAAPVAPAVLISPDPTLSDSRQQAVAALPTINPNDLHWQKLVLQHAIPLDVLRTMHWDRGAEDPTPFQQIGHALDKPSVTNGPGISLVPGYPGYPSYANSPSVPIGFNNGGPGGANRSANEANRSTDPNAQANQFPGGGFGGGGFGGGGTGFGGGGFGGGGVPFGGGGNPFQQGGIGGGLNGRPGAQAPLPEGVTTIYALQSDNSLLIEATPEGFNRVRQIVKNLDVAPRQVQIKVEFVTASVDDIESLGINFDLVPYPGVEISSTQGSSSRIQSAISSGAETYLQYATGNLVASLFQALIRSRGKVVQSPLITTTNNVPASITVSQDIPYVTTGAVIVPGNNNNVAQTNQANNFTITSGLFVTPRINSDDTVTLNLQPQITDISGNAVAGAPPPTTTQSLTTLRTVRSGETMVLGGLVRKAETNSQSRYPLLSELPLIGSIFRTKSKHVVDSELLIFVTPTIIGEDNVTGAGGTGSSSATFQGP